MDIPHSMPTVEIPDEKDKRFSVLSYDQVMHLKSEINLPEFEDAEFYICFLRFKGLMIL